MATVEFGKHYLKLTQFNGKEIYIKSSSVEMVSSVDGGTGTIVCTSSDNWIVKEKLEDVLRLIGGYFFLKTEGVEASKK